MPKGTRQARNPVEKLVAQVSQLNNVVDSILESADKPGFVEAIVALKSKKTETQAKGPNQNKEAKEVNKLLKTYPGLAKTTLAGLKAKIAEYKGLAVLEKYKQL